MGVNTDGKETGPGSTVTDGVEHTEKACEFEQHRENKKSSPQDADCDVGIQEHKPAKGTGIPLVTSPQNMPSLHTSGVLNTEHNNAQKNHTDRGYSVIYDTPTLLRPDADKANEKTELSHGTLVNLNTDTSANDRCVKWEECSSSLQLGEIMEILETDTNDASYAMYTTLNEESLCDVSASKPELPLNPDIDQLDEVGYTQLYKAALKGHLAGVGDLISRGANPNKPSKGGLRPLHAAAQEGHAWIVDFLILQGADVSVECELGQTPLHTAAANGYVDILESFIAEGPDLNQEDNTGWTPFNAAVQEGHLGAVTYLITQGAKWGRYGGKTPLYLAARYGHLEVVQFFILKGTDVNEEDDEGETPLHGAAARGHLKVMEYLIQQGSDVNKGDAEGWTPFNAAVQYGHLDAVKHLIAEGAKQNTHDEMTPLYAAAQFGHLDVLEFFIDNGADVNEEDDEGETPLHGAAARGHMKIMEFLIQQGSDVNKVDAKGWTPFNAAVQCGHLDAVKYLIAEGAKQNRDDGMTPLYAAAQFGHLDIVKFFISKGADVNEEHDEGMIPLHGAATIGHIDIVKYLIQQGSDVNKSDAEGWTPFNAAVQYGHLEAVKYLITEGAKQNRDDGMTPLYVAARFGYIRIVDYFISKGADVNEEDDKGVIPLQGAAAGGNVKVMEYLIHQGSDVNKASAEGSTPLNAAVQYGNIGAVKYLMTKGAKQNIYGGMTPLYAAAYFGHLDIVKFFVSNGDDVNAGDDDGMTPLHGAAFQGHMKVMEYLIQQGSDVNKKDNTGWTPFNAVIQNGDLGAVNYLMTNGAKQNRYIGMTPLYAAARLGHLDIVKFLISNGADVNKENAIHVGLIPLHGAAINGNIDVMEYLIQQGSIVNKGDANNWTPFDAAIEFGHLEAVQYLEEIEGVKPNRNDGMTPFHNAAKFGHLDIIKFFIGEGADVNKEDDTGKIPLHDAASGGHLEVMEYLIQQGSDVNKSDDKSWTPIIASVQNGHLKAVEYLMTKGAKPNRNGGMPPLYAAAHFGHLDIIKSLVSKEADVNKEDDDGMTPLHGAAIRGHVKVMEYLIQQGSDVNKKDNTGGTAFNAAVKEGHLRAVKYLMAKGAKGTRFHGMSPLYIATQYDHVDIVQFLVSDGYDVNERNECGKSPLHAACYNGSMDIVKVLIHHNANVNEQDHNGWSPLNAAAQEGHQDIVDYLALNGADMHVRDIYGLTPLHAAVNAGHPHAIEGISSCRGDPDEEENGFPRSGGHQNLITRGHVTITMKDDKHSRKRQLAYQLDNEDGNDCTKADNAKRGEDEISLKSLPARTNDDEKGGNEEHNPFAHAKLKYPDKVEQEPMLDQREAITSPVTKKRDTTTNGTDCSSPRGSQTWQHIGFDLPYLQIMGTDGHPSEKPESRCHSLIDENMRESSSPINAGNDLPINETSVKFESFPTHPPAVVHQKLYDGNPVTSDGTTSNPVWKIRTKRRTSVYRCSSFLALVHTFLQMIIALAIILAGSPVLVVGIDITERVTLQAGKPGMVPFHFPLPPIGTPQTVPYYTLRFESQPRPFCINGQADIEGFKISSQLRRFTTSVTDVDTSPCVNLMIDDVDTVDEDGYVLTTVWHSFEDVWHKTMKKEIVVQIPPGPAKCFITLSGNSDYPYEVHCRTTTGSVTTTLSCYQNGQMIDVKGDITDNGLITSGIFWLHDYTHFSCCSHDVTSHVNETTCNDFVWPSGKETTKQTINTDPTPVTTPTPQVESHTGSGACRQFMLPSLWHFTYLSVYLLFYVLTMY